MFNLRDLLIEMIEKKASDLHITAGIPPQLRIDGHIASTSHDKLTPEDTLQITYSVLNEEQQKRFEADKELDFSFGVKGLSRFRANVFLQRGVVSLAIRQIPYEIMEMKQLGLPPVVEKLAEKHQGLLLVTGPTGCGKSTTLASIIDKINRERRCHIVTIEDPIEYIHQHKRCIVNQREVKSDTESFGAALKHVLRQDPDVILIGEMRDLETIESALRIAETGRLTFATLHTNSAAQTINRIIDVFPAHQQSQIRAQLSFVLEGILCQSLLPRANGHGRVLAMEVLIPNSAIRNLIREDKVHQIYSAMQTGQTHFGMQTFNQSLATLFLKKQITVQLALSMSSNPDELQEMMNRGTGLINAPTTAGVGGTRAPAVRR